MKHVLKFWDWRLFDHFTWDNAATLLAAVLGAAITVGLAVIGYFTQQAAARRERAAGVYAEALRAVEDYLEGPYRIRRRDGSAGQRAVITTWLSDVKSRHNYYSGLLRLHAPKDVADGYDDLLRAAIADAGPQMTAAWQQPPTYRDTDVPLGSGYDRHTANAAKSRVLAAMKRDLDHRWWRLRGR
jgi:hypothetical protein